jgi:GAF domain-containing protein
MTDAAAHADPFRTIIDVAEALVSSPMLGEALQNVGAAIGEAMNVAAVEVLSLDAGRKVLVVDATWSRPDASLKTTPQLASEIPLDARPAARRAIDSRKVVVVRADDPGLADADVRSLTSRGIKSALVGPLAIGGQIIGVAEIAETRFVRTFLSMELERFEQLCGLAAAAKRNADAFTHERRHSRQLESLLGVGQPLAGTHDAGPVCEAAARALVRGLDAARAWVFESDAALTPVLRAVHPADQIPDGLPAADLSQPIARHGETVGLLLASWDGLRELEAEELAFVRAVADQTALALDNERLARSRT